MTSNFRFYAIFAPFWSVLSRISWLCTFFVNDICRWQMEQHYHRTNKTIGSQPSIDSWFSLVFPLSWHLKKSLVNKLSLALKKFFHLLFLHNVWKSPKKSHLTLRATLTFWVAKKSLKVPKMVNFGEFLKHLKFTVKQCYQIGQF